MAIEWNTNEVNEFLIKLFIAKAVKKLLKSIDEKGINFLEQELNQDNLMKKYFSEIIYLINNLHDNEDNEDDDYDYLDPELYFQSIERFSILINLIPMKSIITELETDDFMYDYSNYNLEKIDGFERYFDSTCDMDVDLVENMISNGDSFVKIRITDRELINYINKLDQEGTFAKSLVKIIAGLYDVDSILLESNKHKITIYGIHDIFKPTTKAFENILSSLIKFMAIYRIIESGN